MKSSIPVEVFHNWYRWNKETGEVSACQSNEEFMQACQDDRRVALEKTWFGAAISTVFLGLDHGYWDSKSPILWETMVFYAGSWSDRACERCSTHEEALVMHENMVKEVYNWSLFKKLRLFFVYRVPYGCIQAARYLRDLLR